MTSDHRLQHFAAEMTSFQREFGRDLSVFTLAELLVCERLELTRCANANNTGYDAVDNYGQRYQIKYRSLRTEQVKINNFQFDWLALVNLTADYHLAGIWCIRADTVKPFCKLVTRGNWRTNQSVIKRSAEQVYEIDGTES